MAGRDAVVWAIAWFYAVWSIDTRGYQWGGSGPDEVDFLDVGLVVRVACTVMVVVAAALVTVGVMWRKRSWLPT